jgi:hypothetical protein
MQKSVAAASHTFLLPLWARIGMAIFMSAVSAVCMWSAFFRFDWIGFLCFGIVYLIYIPIQKGESRRAHFSKPRTVFSFILLTIVMAAAMYSLHYTLTKDPF